MYPLIGKAFFPILLIPIYKLNVYLKKKYKNKNKLIKILEVIVFFLRKTNLTTLRIN